MSDRSSDSVTEGLDRNPDIPLPFPYEHILDFDVQQSLPHVLLMERHDYKNDSLQIRPPEYSSSRLTNFILFEQQRKKLAIRSKYINELTEDEDDPFVLLIARYLAMVTGINMVFSAPHRTGIKESKPMSYDLHIQARLNVTGDEVDKVLQRIDALPSREELHAIQGVEERFSYEITYAKQAAHDAYVSKQYENAIKICNKFLGRFPDDLEILFTLGFSYHDSTEQNHLELAEVAFKLILESYYENGYAWFNLAMIYQELSEYDKELFCLKRALSFGYPADNARIELLVADYKPVDPFADEGNFSY
jgi:tetratricopeptide (TPR) repeat protein